MATTPITIAILGGGGRYWAPSVLMDLALCPQLSGEIRLHDLAPPRRTAALGRSIFAHRRSVTTFRLTATNDLRRALRGADVVVIGISPGPTACFVNDLEITARHGILHSVGDTTGPAGISRCLRTVPLLAGFGEAIGRWAPAAWVINYTNPMTIATAALYAGFPGIKAFGCCHEVYGTQRWLAQLLAAERGLRQPPRQAVRLDIAGVNHCTLALGASWQGEDLFPLLRQVVARRGFFADRTPTAVLRRRSGAFWDHDARIACDLFRRFGALGAAGDRHLAEFFPWYLAEGEAGLHRWGVVATPAAFRAGTWRPDAGVTPAPNPLDHGDILVTGPRPSGEEGVAQICALLGLGDLDTNVNLPNRGQVPDLPEGAVVETNAAFRQDRVTPLTAPFLPDALAAHLQRIAAVQQLTLAAGRTCDFDLALQAMLLDPLCHVGTDTAATMLRELLAANAAFLPGWRA
jgi:alpha-galactosidase